MAIVRVQLHYRVSNRLLDERHLARDRISYSRQLNSDMYPPYKQEALHRPLQGKSRLSSLSHPSALRSDCGGKVCLYNGTLDLRTCQCQCSTYASGSQCERCIDIDQQPVRVSMFFFFCSSELCSVTALLLSIAASLHRRECPSGVPSPMWSMRSIRRSHANRRYR